MLDYELETAWDILRSKLIRLAHRLGADEDDVQTVIMRFISKHGVIVSEKISPAYWYVALRNVRNSESRRRTKPRKYGIQVSSMSDIDFTPQPPSPSTTESWVDLLDLKNDPEVLRMITWGADCKFLSPLSRARKYRLQAKLRKKYRRTAIV